MEALYAPPGDPVFELVPPAFHEHVSELYTMIGQPQVNITSFWDIYLELLKLLRDRHDDQLARILDSHTAETHESEDMPLLPGMEAFRLGQPLQPGKRGQYIGGLDDVSLGTALQKLGVEYADFTDGEGDSDSGGIDDENGDGRGDDADE
jgi:hypothetical protein